MAREGEGERGREGVPGKVGRDDGEKVGGGGVSETG